MMSRPILKIHTGLPAVYPPVAVALTVFLLAMGDPVWAACVPRPHPSAATRARPPYRPGAEDDLLVEHHPAREEANEEAVADHNVVVAAQEGEREAAELLEAVVGH